MKALILDPERQTANVETVPDPQPLSNELLIRTVALALNPVDSLYVFNPLALTRRTVGSDFAGVVEALGDAVPPASGLKLGDRVAGFLQGACSVNERPGAFADYMVCDWDLVWRVGNEIRLQEAAAISLCGLTAAQALFFRMGLQAPFDWPERPATATGPQELEQKRRNTVSVFIYGASTSVGLYAAQLARRSAESSASTIKLFGTAGEKHFKMLKAELYGYDGLVDYHDKDWPSKIRALTDDGKGVDYAYDCISEGETVSKTNEILSPSGKMAIVRSREGGAWTTAQNLPVEPSYGAVWEGLGKVVQYQGMSLPASPTARSFAVSFYKWLSTTGGGDGKKLEPSPLREMPGGLESIVGEGFRLLGSGSMGDRDAKSDKAWMKPLSGEKMMYRIGDE